MTRKTKEEKKLAEYRRRIKLLRESIKPEIASEEKTAIKNIDPVSSIRSELPTLQTEQQTYFKKDLKKSLIFISLIITLEIIIYFAKLKIY